MFQAWFDDSGKEGIKGSPVYLLAGYSARVRVWKDFTHEWQTELDQYPRLKFIHAKEAYGWKGEFGADKYGQDSEWTATHGRRNRKERDARLLKFAKIIVKHLQPDNDSHGVTWLVSHKEYSDFVGKLSKVKTATIQDHRDFEKIKNPYYLSFQKVLGQELKLRVAKGIFDGDVEKTEVLFDEDIDNPYNLENGFKDFMEVLRLEDPRFLNFFQNKKPEYRDDKLNPPLQAADLLAWHLRRMCWEISRGATKYDDDVWRELSENGIKYWDFRYHAADWDRILTNVRMNALVQLGFAMPPIR